MSWAPIEKENELQTSLRAGHVHQNPHILYPLNMAYSFINKHLKEERKNKASVLIQWIITYLEPELDVN